MMSNMSPTPSSALEPAVYVVVVYDYVDNMLERRAPHRPDHLARAHAAKERGELINAGAIGDAEGAFFVFAPGAEEAARAFVEDDPYVRAGLVPTWRVTTWNVVS
jgi:uncharacterized protein YciI